jgi:WD40 repeat protein
MRRRSGTRRWQRPILWLSLALGAPLAAGAGEPPNEPQLRVETEQHQGAITRIGVDAANRFLVTGSDDKTARVWDLATGRLLRVLRPPIGPGHEGKLYAVALSPDGQTVAVGGWTGVDWDGTSTVYLFDRASRHLLHRLTGLPQVIFHLAFSPDGRALAVTLGGTHGLRVYRPTDGTLVGEDRTYGDSSHGAAFDAAGRVVTTSSDGSVRLYSASVQLLAKRAAPGGSRPAGVAFSPDGTKVAVGFQDTSTVSVLSGSDLSVLGTPDTSGVNDGSLGSVAWSADGQRLYAGGRYPTDRTKLIRIWDHGGQGSGRDVPAGSHTIRALLPLQDGGVAFGAADPAFGVLDALGRQTLFRGSALADYRKNRAGFLVSSDAATVQFSYEPGGRAPAQVAVAARAVTVGPAERGLALAAPRTSAPGLTVTDWQNTTAPKLNGQPLNLKQNEPSRSVAITPDGQRLVLGADWSLRLFDATGREQWQVPVPGLAWAVNVAGQVAVAALGDGTLRWYRLRDGQELLAFFPHANKKDWVLWTPSGYFDASPGGDDLIGWHVNRGKDQAADFYPAAQFHNTYYRPDVVAKVLETLDEGAAVRAANRESGRKAPSAALTEQLPPVVTILSPTEGASVSTSDLTVRFTVRAPSGEAITGVKVLVDGRPLSVARDLKVTANAQAESDVHEFRVTIPERDAEIAILAENRHSTSVPAIVRVKWQGGGIQNKPGEFVIQPKLYVLAVGVSQYQNKDFTLGFPAKDAQDFVTVLQSQKGKLYREVTAKVLTDGQATRDEIMDGLDWLKKETTSKDVAMLFLAGHGVNDPIGIYYYLPTNGNPDKLMRTGVVFSDIKNTLASIAGKALFFVDTCHSGNIMGTRRGVADINAVVNELASAENGAVVFASSTGKQYSLEDQAWNNGAFTKALVEGLSGKADYTGKGTISINMLDLYLSERVKTLTGGKQTPTTTKPNTVPDFPVAVIR